MQHVAKCECIHGSENGLIRPQMPCLQSIGPFTEHLLSSSDSLWMGFDVAQSGKSPNVECLPPKQTIPGTTEQLCAFWSNLLVTVYSWFFFFPAQRLENSLPPLTGWLWRLSWTNLRGHQECQSSGVAQGFWGRRLFIFTQVKQKIIVNEFWPLLLVPFYSRRDSWQSGAIARFLSPTSLSQY